MKAAKNYGYFINDELPLIKEHFKKEKGLEVASGEDICTYIGWKERGRKVKRGEKAVKVQSEKLYSVPLFYQGGPVLDEKGRQCFAKLEKGWCLFHKEQTGELPISK